MARARNLKPGFFRDAKVVSCSFQARILFQGLWCMADYMGRLKYNPMEVKMEIFPADDVDVPACMEELNSTGLITMYHDCSGAALVQVTNFTKHQNPHVNERQDRNKNPIPCLPGPDEVAGSDDEEGEEKPTVEQRVKAALVVLREYSESDPADSLNLIPDSLFPLPDSGSPRTDPPPPAGSAGKQRKLTYPDEFEQAWKGYPKRPGNNKRDACKAWEARVKAGADPDDILAGVQRYAAFCRITGKTGTEFVKQGATFFGPSEHYLDDWTPPPPDGKAPPSNHTGFSDHEYTEHLPDWAKEA